jgi:NADPH:quinone reductase-like Zn-dependent oxidoreductase
LEEKALTAQRLIRHVLPLLEAKELQVPIDAAIPMTEATAAYDRFAGGGKLGKIVLVAG